MITKKYFKYIIQCFKFNIKVNNMDKSIFKGYGINSLPL